MLRRIDHQKMGHSCHSYLDSYFHFSFASYYNAKNIQFGTLRVLNDDLIETNAGFPTHRHKDMEIISYILEGELTHVDSMHNKRTLTRGDVQYICAGTGIRHSEYNLGCGRLRLLQIWVLPDASGYSPHYSSCQFAMKDRENQWLHIVGDIKHQENDAPIAIHQDFNLFATLLTNGKTASFSVKQSRQAYLMMAEGAADINGIRVEERDAMEIIEEDILIMPDDSAHLLILEMAKP